MTRKERIAYKNIQLLMIACYNKKKDINPYSNRLGMSRWDFSNADLGVRNILGINCTFMPANISNEGCHIIGLYYKPKEEYGKFTICDVGRHDTRYAPAEFIEAILRYKFRNNIDSLLIYLNTLLVEVV